MLEFKMKSIMEVPMKYAFLVFSFILVSYTFCTTTMADTKSTSQRLQDYGFSPEEAAKRAQKLEELKKKSTPSNNDAKNYINQTPNKRGGKKYN